MKYDLAIIGSGPAGYSAAFEAVKHHMSVVLFECDHVGGTCLNRGCVPTKYLSHVSRKFYEIKRDINGITVQDVKVDYDITVSRMNEMIDGLRDGLDKQLQSDGISIVRGIASIIGEGTVACHDKVYDAENILIATGSVPVEPLVERAITSDGLLQMDHIPKKLHILGGGTVAIEFAEIFCMFGSEVSISIRSDRILRGWDKEISVGLIQNMKRKGIVIQKTCDFSKLDLENDAIVLSATGRKASIPSAIDGLFDLGDDGGIIVDKNGQTKTAGVFAAGDVIGGSSKLAHVGMDQGRRVVQYIAGDRVSNAAAVVRCIYLDQEVASVGFSEQEVKEKNIHIISAKQTMFSNARTLISTDERGFIKVLAETGSHKVIGAQLMCERAGEIVSELALAINKGLTVEDMLSSVRPHPSYCEVVTETIRSLKDKLDGM